MGAWMLCFECSTFISSHFHPLFAVSLPPFCPVRNCRYQFRVCFQVTGITPIHIQIHPVFPAYRTLFLVPPVEHEMAGITEDNAPG
jgi:hypothetical protein